MNSKLFNGVLLSGLLMLTCGVSRAEEKPAAVAAVDVATAPTAPVLATKTEWAKGLKEPQGLAHFNNEILVADYGAGKVLRYSRDGKLLVTLAEGLKSPSQIVATGGRVFVSERKANRVIEIGANGKVTPVGQAIEEPLGLVSVPENYVKGSLGSKAGVRKVVREALYVVAHTTSKVYRFDGVQWQLVFAAPLEAGDEERYGYRCLAYDGTLLMTDEVGEKVIMLTRGGRLATWTEGIADPSGITIGPDGMTYVCDESDGGRLYHINNLGEKTIVAEGLGRPRGILFLNNNTALVSDRNGKIWKLVFPVSAKG